jgi:hypothetical protein
MRFLRLRGDGSPHLLALSKDPRPLRFDNDNAPTTTNILLTLAYYLLGLKP